MIKVSFEAEDAVELHKQILAYATFPMAVLPTQGPVNHFENGLDSKPSTEKRKPGRPIETPEKKAAKNSELLKEVAHTKMVGPPGFEPGTPEQKQDNTLDGQDSSIDLMGEKPETPTPAKKIAKTDLELVLRKLYEKENLAAGNNKAGMDKVKAVYAKFGIPHLRDLDEKRFHEMYAVVEGLLS